MTSETQDNLAPILMTHRDWLVMGLLLLLVAAVGVAFFWPWLQRPSPGGDALQTLDPLYDGRATLHLITDAGGARTGWRSGNVTEIPNNVALVALGEGAVTPLLNLYGAQQDINALPDLMLANDAQFFRVQQRMLDANGVVQSQRSLLLLRDNQGEYLLEMTIDDGAPAAFDPLLQTWQSNPAPGAAWGSRGSWQGQSYDSRSRVAAGGAPPQTAVSLPDSDCLQLENTFSANDGAATARAVAWYCAGLGAVLEETRAPDGSLLERAQLVAADRLPAADADLLPPAAPPLPAAASLTSAPPALGDPAQWQLTRLARILPAGDNLENTIPPTWLPADPPLLLTAGHQGPLTALDPTSGDVSWTFKAGGTIYGAPAVDAENGRLYFGASNKRLYALTAQGALLWGVETADNVPTRPAIAGDTVIFGSEDQTIYCLDAATGQARGQLRTNGAVAGSPAVVNDTLALIGADDGGVYAVTPATCAQQWLFDAGSAVEAAVVVADGVAYVAARETLWAINPTDGAVLWQSEANDVQRFAPAVAEDRLFIIDVGGQLSAVARRSGRFLWSTPQFDYVGEPLVVGETVLAATENGRLTQFDFAGNALRSWEAQTAVGLADAAGAGFAFGPIAAGDAIWLADDAGVVRRLGPPAAAAAAVENEPAPDAAALSLKWSRDLLNAPVGTFVFAPPFVANGQPLLLDVDGSVLTVDTTNGEVAFRSSQRTATGLVWFEPAVQGHWLVGARKETNELFAVDVRSGERLWTVTGFEPYRPPLMIADKVVWATQESGGDTVGNVGGGRGLLQALDLATGTELWRTPLSDFFVVGGLAARDGVIYTATPPAAFDAATGRPLWQADLRGIALGQPVLNEPGTLLYVGAAEDDAGTIVALDTAGGQVVWRRGLPDGHVLHFVERLWLADGLLIVPTFQGDVMALDARLGQLRWRYTPPVARYGAITVSDGWVLLTLVDGTVAALSVETGERVAAFTGADVALSADEAFYQRPLLLEDTVLVLLDQVLIGLTRP